MTATTSTHNRSPSTRLYVTISVPEIPSELNTRTLAVSAACINIARGRLSPPSNIRIIRIRYGGRNEKHVAERYSAIESSPEVDPLPHQTTSRFHAPKTTPKGKPLRAIARVAFWVACDLGFVRRRFYRGPRNQVAGPDERLSRSSDLNSEPIPQEN